MRYFIFSFSFLILLKFGIADDVCANPMSNFLQCMVDDAEKKLNRVIKEVSPEIKQAVQECFVKNGCEKPDFSQATLSNFLKEPWLSRATDMLAILDDIDPKVKDCMMHYFLDLIRNRVNDCVKDKGADDVKDFEMPPLPDVHNIDVSKFKEIVLNRLMVRSSIQKCNETKGEVAENATVACIVDARLQYDQSMCTTRMSCREQKLTDEKCRDRLDKVHTAVCQCKISANAGELLMNGKLEKQFKKCYDENNVPYPEEKVKKARDAIVTSMKEVFSKHRKVPEEVRQLLSLARQAMSDIEGQWKGAFCAECSKSGDTSSGVHDSEVEFLKQRSP